MNSLVDFQKLEKVEVNGLMGRCHSIVIEDMYLQFTKFMDKVVSISYDPLDILNETSNTAFLEDYQLYLNMSEDFDNCLVTISKGSFENNENLMALQKVFIHFELIFVIYIT